jgi:hypothetical protein
MWPKKRKQPTLTAMAIPEPEPRPETVWVWTALSGTADEVAAQLDALTENRLVTNMDGNPIWGVAMGAEGAVVVFVRVIHLDGQRIGATLADG